MFSNFVVFFLQISNVIYKYYNTICKCSQIVTQQKNKEEYFQQERNQHKNKMPHKIFLLCVHLRNIVCYTSAILFLSLTLQIIL